MKSLWRRNEDGSVSRSIDGGKNWLKSNWALVPREVLKAFAKAEMEAAMSECPCPDECSAAEMCQGDCLACPAAKCQSDDHGNCVAENCPMKSATNPNP